MDRKSKHLNIILHVTFHAERRCTLQSQNLSTQVMIEKRWTGGYHSAPPYLSKAILAAFSEQSGEMTGPIFPSRQQHISGHNNQCQMYKIYGYSQVYSRNDCMSRALLRRIQHTKPCLLLNNAVDSTPANSLTPLVVEGES